MNYLVLNSTVSGTGHDLKSIQYAKVKASTTAGDVDALVICIKATPSMKSNDYWVTSVFEDKIDGELIVAPNSWCECPCQCLFCLHMLGLLAIIYLIQSRPSWSFHRTFQTLPPAIKSIAKTPIPWWLAFQTLVHSRK
jgi:hypothetical protein